MVSLALVVIMSLAAYRVTRAITRDAVFDTWRDRWFPNPDESKIAYLMTCDFCTGFWVSAIVVAATNACVDFSVPFLIWWAVAGLQSLLASWEV